MPKTMKKKLTNLSKNQATSSSASTPEITKKTKSAIKLSAITTTLSSQNKNLDKSSINKLLIKVSPRTAAGNKGIRKRNDSKISRISGSTQTKDFIFKDNATDDDRDSKLLIINNNNYDKIDIKEDEQKIEILDNDDDDDDDDDVKKNNSTNNNENLEFYKFINDNYSCNSNNNNNNINDFIAIKTNRSRSNSITSNQNCINIIGGSHRGGIGGDCSDTNISSSSLRSDNSKFSLSSSLNNNNINNSNDTNNNDNNINNEDSQKSDNNSAGRKRNFAHRIRRGERKKYICNICHKNFQGLNDLRKHTRIHSDERPYPCPNCEKKFRQAGCLKNHIASQHGTDVLFICHYCNKSFPIKERLRLHLRIHTGEKPYKCSICPKQFARGGQLTQHLLTHNGIKKYRCDYCPAAFSCLSNLKLHMKGHRDERDYTCHMCGKGFLRPDALKKHLLCFHGNIKAFHCKICNKMFKGHLPQHMRTHKKVKPHGCAECGAAFSQRSQLIVHQRMHSGERPYRCQVCWQAFAHSSVLKLHIRKHTGEKPFKCPLCVQTESAFSQLPHLKKHMKAIHDQEKSYMCEVCNEFFKTKIEHQQHTSMCFKYDNDPDSLVDFIDIKVPNINIGVEPAMALSRMRLLVAVLLKKISTEDRLKQLGFEKRLIDNVLIGSLKLAGRNVCEDETIRESERLKINVQELLEWTVPDQYMDKFKKEQRSTEELLEELTS